MSSENALLPRVWELERSLATAVRVNESLRQQLSELKSELKDIGKAIDDPRTDLTMTMSEVIIDQKKQLAAVIAACKLKDEALQNCEGMLDELRDYPITHDAIIEALAIQPDDSVLKAWLGEPVAWKHDDPKRHDAITDSVKELLRRANSEYMHRPIDKTEHYTIPLYSPKGLK